MNQAYYQKIKDEFREIYKKASLSEHGEKLLSTITNEQLILNYQEILLNRWMESFEIQYRNNNPIIKIENGKKIMPTKEEYLNYKKEMRLNCINEMKKILNTSLDNEQVIKSFSEYLIEQDYLSFINQTNKAN